MSSTFGLLVCSIFSPSAPQSPPTGGPAYFAPATAGAHSFRVCGLPLEPLSPRNPTRAHLTRAAGQRFWEPIRRRETKGLACAPARQDHKQVPECPALTTRTTLPVSTQAPPSAWTTIPRRCSTTLPCTSGPGLTGRWSLDGM